MPVRSMTPFSFDDLGASHCLFRRSEMNPLFFAVSAIVQLGLMGTIIAYSFRQIMKCRGHRAVVAIAYVTTVSLVAGTLFICAGAFLEKLVSRDRMEDIGVVGTVVTLITSLVCGVTALVCLLRSIRGWRMVFVLQALATLYLTLILSYVAMGKPFLARCRPPTLAPDEAFYGFASQRAPAIIVSTTAWRTDSTNASLA